jgi:hypothetical protein
LRRRLPPLVLALALLAPGARAARGDGVPAPAPAPPEPRPAPRFLGPRAGPERARALARHGGTAATERAVEAALDWLARHQEPDGGWDADGFPGRCAGEPRCEGVGKGQHGEEGGCPFDAAISGLAVLAFVGAGRGPWVEGDPHGPVVERGLARLARGDDVWSLPISTQAFAEAEAAEGKGRFAEATRARAARLLAARREDGGWGYLGGFREGSDVPYTALAVAALVAARDVGTALPAGLAADADRFLSSLEADRGRLAYWRDGRSAGYTPTAANGLAAAAVREWLEVGRGGARHRAHLLLTAKAPEWRISFREMDVPGHGRRRVQVGHLSLYEWWYGTEAKFQAGVGWGTWYAALSAALLSHQRTTGCARGSWDPEGVYERQTGGRVFATALAALMLETPYRRRRLSEAAAAAPPRGGGGAR